MTLYSFARRSNSRHRLSLAESIDIHDEHFVVKLPYTPIYDILSLLPRYRSITRISCSKVADMLCYIENCDLVPHNIRSPNISVMAQTDTFCIFWVPFVHQFIDNHRGDTSIAENHARSFTFSQPHLKATHPRLAEPFSISPIPHKDMAPFALIFPIQLMVWGSLIDRAKNRVERTTAELYHFQRMEEFICQLSPLPPRNSCDRLRFVHEADSFVHSQPNHAAMIRLTSTALKSKRMGMLYWSKQIERKTVRPTSLPVRVFSLDSWKRPSMSTMVGY
ncbi:Uncharacterized protein LW93_7481 [Fusarium fujikuroi]|nr:Uncharacterized protein LW93_7481 [Fusarium fujikuroi]